MRFYLSITSLMSKSLQNGVAAVEGSVLTGWRYRAVIITLLLGAAGYLALSAWVGWEGMVKALRQFGLVGLGFALSLTVLSLTMRLFRWQLYLGRLSIRLPFMASTRIYIGGLALTATPGKAGEAIRGIFLKRWGVDHLRSLSIFFADRFTDLIAVMLLAAGGVWSKPEAWPAAAALLAFIGIILLVIQTPSLYAALMQRLSALIHWQRAKNLFQYSAQVLTHCNTLFSPRVFLSGLLLAVFAWGLEAVNFYWINSLLHIEILFSTAVFIYAFAKLVGAISMIPGGFGSTEATLVALLVFNGADETSAVACALILRLTTFWFVVSLGMLALPKK